MVNGGVAKSHDRGKVARGHVGSQGERSVLLLQGEIDQGGRDAVVDF
jgi:hypothetical protein